MYCSGNLQTRAPAAHVRELAVLAARVIPADVDHESGLEAEARRPAVAADEFTLLRRDHALGRGAVERHAKVPTAPDDRDRGETEATVETFWSLSSPRSPVRDRRRIGDR